MYILSESDFIVNNTNNNENNEKQITQEKKIDEYDLLLEIEQEKMKINAGLTSCLDLPKQKTKRRLFKRK